MQIVYDRYDDSRAAVAVYEAYKGQGHKARAFGAALAVEQGLPVPQECAEAAGFARHRAAKIWRGDIRTRMFLAWPRDTYPHS